METGEIITYALTALGGGGITQFFNWRINKRKGTAEVKRDEIENIHRTVEDVYKPLIEQQNHRIKELEDEVRGLRNQLAQERAEHQEAMSAMQKQIVEINRALGINAKKAIRDKKTGRFVSRKKEER